MIRLGETLAATRVLYRRPIATLPDILVINVPAPFAHPSLSLGRYYGIMIETDDERLEIDEFLELERAAPVPPDLLDRRPSALTTARITMCEYTPPTAEWPWILLCHWPSSYTSAVPAEADMFARDAYTIEMFTSQKKLADSAAVLVATLGRSSEVAVSMISGDGPSVAGRA